MHDRSDPIRRGLAQVAVAMAALLTGACGDLTTLLPGSFSVEVTTDHQQAVPEQGSSAERTVVVLTADPIGGTPPYRYAWSVTNPLGELENDHLSALDTESTVFTGGELSGLYEVTCTVTDALGRRARKSVIIPNGQSLTIDVRADHSWVTSGGGASGQTTVSVQVTGGTPTYTYAWSVTDPSGQIDDTRLSDTTSATTVFTSGSQVGSYVVSCTVYDAFGVSFTDSVAIIAVSLLSLDVSADQQQLTPGGGEWGVAFLEAHVTGGTPDYTYAWRVITPAHEVDNDRLSNLTSATPTFTSSDVTGVYRVVCTVTDAAGQQLTDSVLILVGPGLLLTISVTREEVAAAGGGVGETQLSATIVGGTEPFTYLWSVTDPNGQPDDNRLDSVTSATPTFTSWSTLGTYHVFCTVTDAEGRVGFDSTEIYVGQPIGVDVRTERQDVPADGATAQLGVFPTGGLPPYSYGWLIYNPSGTIENARLNDASIPQPLFTSSLTTGTYTATCTVIDSGGFVAVDSVGLVVGGGLDQGLSVVVTTNRQNVPATGGTANLSAAATGGVVPVAYAWTVIDPGDNTVTGTTLDNPAIAGPTFTAPATVGTYRIRCTVTDSVLKTFTGAVDLYVGQNLSVSVTTSRQSVVPGGGANGQATLDAAPLGGLTPYTYAWAVTNPSGGAENARLSATNVQSPTFTSAATVGTYRLSCTVTDSYGSVFINSVDIHVGFELSASITTSRSTIMPGGGANGQATLDASAIGGAGGYTYLWAVTNPSSAGEDARLSATNVQSPTFTSVATVGTYRVTCTITDTLGAQYTAATYLFVGNGLSASITTSRATIMPGGGANGQATLDASAIGGAGGYTYLWAVTNPSGAGEDARLSSTAVQSPTFTSVATVGTYRVACTITDTLGAQYTAATHLFVGNGLSASITTSRATIMPGGGANGQATLTATPLGGSTPYTYLWAVTNPSGAGEDARLSATNVQSPTFTSVATVGTYRVTCTVTDTLGAQYTAATHLFVGNGLSASITTSRATIMPGGGANGQSTLSASAIGGAGGYTYLWAVTNPSSAGEDARLSATNVQSPTFTSVATVGTYRVTCTVTDTLGTQYTAATQLFVGNGLSASITTSRSTIMPGGGANGQATLTATPLGGSTPYTYLWAVTNPSGAGEDARLGGGTALQSPTFTSIATVGTYRVACTITDTLGTQYTAATQLFVGNGLSASITTSRSTVMPGGGANGQSTLSASAIGGAGGYTYLWAVTNPSGAGEDARLSATNVQSPTFTSAATVGTYRVTCTITDTLGAQYTAATHLYVGQDFSVRVTTSRQSVVPGGGANGQTTLNASASGGAGGYTYLWAVTNPSSAGEDARLGGGTALQSPTFTSDTTIGTYRLSCTVTDSNGAVISGAIDIFVGFELSASVTTSRLTVMAGGGANGQATLSASAIGGAGGYTYLWAATNPSSAGEDARLSATNVQSPTFTSAATVGTYRVTCTITDSLGTQYTGAVHVFVGNALSVSITQTRSTVVSGGGANGQSTLTASPLSGASPYTYLWAATNPSGGGADARLSATDVQSPVFTSAAIVGTYRFVCTVTDNLGASFTAATHITVGNWLSARITTNRTQVMPSGGANGQASLSATPLGGASPYTYLWAVTDPSDNSADARLSATGVQSPTFTSDATIGTYRIACTVTDSLGMSITNAVHVTVGNWLSANITTNRARVVPGGGANGQASLNAAATGGAGGYTYLWAVTNPSGAGEDARLDATNVQSPTFTSVATVGTYRVSCQVTDSVGATFTASVNVTVTQDLSVSLTTNRTRIVPGGGANGQATLDASAIGGAGGYTYLWAATNPSGAGEDARLSATDVQSPTFTSIATVGTYRVVCTVTDSVGVAFKGALHLYVSQDLSVSLTTSRSRVVPSGGANGQASLDASASGGAGGYTYLWAVTNPSGGAENARLSATNVQSPTFTSAATVGTYRVVCTVTDSVGVTFAGAVHVIVTQDLSVNVTTSRSRAVPGGGANGQATLDAGAIGGEAPYTYLWAVTNPSGGAEDVRLSATNVQSPTFTSAATVGTYRVGCTVTDSVGVTFTGSVSIVVTQDLSVYITSDRTFVLPGGGGTGQANLTATATGGAGGYTYLWAVTNPSGGAEDARLSATNVAAPVFTSTTTQGTYRVTCTVTDSVGVSVADSVHIEVGQPAVFLDIRGDKLTLLPGEKVNLVGDRVGGKTTFSYEWRALDSTGADQDAWDDDDDGAVGGQQNTRADDVTQGWTAPPDAYGTYRIYCTVTDASGYTFTDSLQVQVSTAALTLTLPVAADADASPTSVKAATNFYDRYVVVTVNVTLTYPRTLKVRVTDTNSSMGDDLWVAVSGVGPGGYPQVELLDFGTPGAAKTVESSQVFWRVDRVYYQGRPTGTVGTDERIMIGVGNTFGLPVVISSASAVRKVTLLPNTTLATPADYTVITTPGQQGVRFVNAANDPDGTTNTYQILYDDN